MHLLQVHPAEQLQYSRSLGCGKWPQLCSPHYLFLLNMHLLQVLPAEQFDHVVVASGHYSVPNVPDFPGIAKFRGRVFHAHDFRYTDKNIHES